MVTDKTYCTGVYVETACPLRQNCERYAYNYSEPVVADYWYYNNAPFLETSDGHTVCEHFLQLH